MILNQMKEKKTLKPTRSSRELYVDSQRGRGCRSSAGVSILKPDIKKVGWRGSTHISNVLWFPLQADQLVDINHGHFELALTTGFLIAATRCGGGRVVGLRRKKVAEKLEKYKSRRPL